MLLDVELRINLLQRVERQAHAFFHRQRQHLHGVAHPGIGQADDARLVVAIVEEIGAAGQPVGQRHAHQVAAGLRILLLPERPVGHHEGLGGLHVAGAVQRHPHLVGEQAFLALHVGGEQPALHRHEAGVEKFGVAPAVGNGDLVAIGALDPGGARPCCAVMQFFECRSLRPMRHLLRRQPPQPARHLLDAAGDQALVFVAVGGHDAQDFQHGIGIVRIPAARAEAHLAENLAVEERPIGEGIGGGDEIIETAVVPDGNELVPDGLHLRRIALTHRLAQLGEASTLFQRLGPVGGDLLEHRRQVGGLLGIDGLALEIDDGRGCGGRQRIGKGLRLEAQHVDIVKEAGGGHRKAHAAQFGDDAVGALEFLRAQASADARGFIDHRLQSHLHQLERRRHPRHAGTNDGDFGAMLVRRDRAQALRVLDPVIEGEGKVRPIHGDGFRDVGVGRENIG